VDAVEEIRRAQAAELWDKKGRRVALDVEAGLEAGEIDAVAAEAGVPLPRELRAVLAHTAGIFGGFDAIDFTGRSFDFGDEEIFPASLPIAHDGSGNHWVLDLAPEEEDVAPVFYACHDPPVVVYQSPDLARFLHEVFRSYEPPHHSLVERVHEDDVFRIWREDPDLIDRAAALAADDELRAFAEELDERFSFVDLREPEVGMGFAWGRFGPRTALRRHGRSRLFAYAPAARKPGRLRRLIGR
jgi:cell wall assembly regulator SMI1